MKNENISFTISVWVRHWKSNQKYSEHKVGINLNSLIIKRWSLQAKFDERRKIKFLASIMLNKT